MAAQGFLLVASFLLVLFVLARPLGKMLAAMIANTPLPGVARCENVLWRALGISGQEMSWGRYAAAIILLNLCGLLALFALLMLQGYLPFNPQQLPGLSWHLALNTAVSFVSNTNWQSYSGETTLSYLSQMAGLTVQNFLSAATGIAVLFATGARLCPPQYQHAGERLGRPHPHYAVAAAADFSAAGVVLYPAGRAAKRSALPAVHLA